MKKTLIIGLILIALGYGLDLATPYDDTDPPGERSGLRLITDHGTGCQYLSHGLIGNITPRIGADYMHMGCKGYEGQE